MQSPTDPKVPRDTAHVLLDVDYVGPKRKLKVRFGVAGAAVAVIVAVLVRLLS